MSFDPVVTKFLKKLERLNLTPFNKLSPKEARKSLEKLQELDEDFPVAEEIIPFKGSNSFEVYLVRPENQEDVLLPGILYIHGGGWVLGSYKTHRRLIADICLETNCAVVFVEYTKSPEAKFPVALNQDLTVLTEMTKEENIFGVDPDQLFVAGDSVGGNAAAVIAQKSPNLLKGQILLYPVTNADFYDASFTQFVNGPWLTKEVMEYFWDSYEPDSSKRVLKAYSPLQTSIEELKGLPPALIFTDENDILRDEGEAYAHKLMQAGVEVTAIRALGTIHDFMMLNDLRKSPATKNCLRTIAEFINAHLD